MKTLLGKQTITYDVIFVWHRIFSHRIRIYVANFQVLSTVHKIIEYLTLGLLSSL